MPGWSVRSTTPSPGSATAPMLATPSIASATCTAQSVRASPYSRVPSTGSTIHTRALREALEVVLLLLGQQPVIGPLLAQRVDEELVGGRVAGLAQRLERQHARSARTSSSSRPATSARWAASSASVMLDHASPSSVSTISVGGLFGRHLGRVDADFGLGRRLIGAVDAGEVLELAGARLLVEALDVALSATASGVSMKISMNSPSGSIARTISRSARNGEMKAVMHDQAGIGHQLRDFADAADVLDPVGLGEAQVLVEPVADVVAVEQEGVPVHRGAASSRPGWRWSTCPSPTAR